MCCRMFGSVVCFYPKNVSSTLSPGVTRMSPDIAENVADLLLKSENVELIHPQFRLGLITADPDDNKFVDCAFAANATYIVSNDAHYDILRTIDFPLLLVIKIQEFVERLNNGLL